MKINAVVAALNDNQKLNSQTIVEAFQEADSKQPLKEIDIELFKEFLKGKSLSKNNKSDIYQEMVETVEEAEINEYQEYLSDLDEKNIEFVSIFEDEYPSGLRTIKKPPLALYVDGNISCYKDGIAVVGTREAHDHRIEYVKKIAQKLVDLDKTVISGLANGVDEAAHQGTLEADGQTIAVLPGHIEKIYPKSNEPIGKSIPENGALVSEVSHKVGINRRRFVERNRITSGLARAVIIGASRDSGGTIRQAEFAQSQEIPFFLYDPEEEDDQSPELLKDMGAETFKDVGKFEELLSSIKKTNHSGENYTLNEYTN